MYRGGGTTELNIDSEKLQKVVNKAIDKYEIKTGEVIDRTGLNEMIDEGVKSAIPELTATLDEVKENYAADFEVIKKVLNILSLKTFIICIIVCVIFAGLIFAINRNIFVTFRYVSVSAIAVGFIIILAGIAMETYLPFISETLKNQAELSDSLITPIVKLLKNIFFEVKVTGFITDLIGVVFCVLGFTLYKKEKKEITENKTVGCV